MSFVVGCGGAPAGALDKSTKLGSPIDHVDLRQIPVKGHRVSVTYGLRACICEGELIAVTPTALVVLDPAGALWQVPLASLGQVEIELYPSDSGSLYTTTTIGSVSTLTHGYWLVITLPVWLGVGLPLASSESSASHVRATRSDLPRLAAYARFPHGGKMDWTGQALPAAECG